MGQEPVCEVGTALWGRSHSMGHALRYGAWSPGAPPPQPHLFLSAINEGTSAPLHGPGQDVGLGYGGGPASAAAASRGRVGPASSRPPAHIDTCGAGAVGLQCLSCGAEDGSCHEATNVTCGPESDVCAEALASVTWSYGPPPAGGAAQAGSDPQGALFPAGHGRLALGGRGCGRGQPGALAHALELPGVVVFVRRRQCRGGGEACNGALPVGTEQALPVAANVTAQAPNGLRCFGCPDDGPCSAPTIVHCYGDLRGCFHGNVTVTLGGSRRWREVRGCVRDPSCAPEPRGDDVVGLEGSCCAGDLCNGPIGNRSLFAPDLPRLELLPQPHGPTKGNGSTGGDRATTTTTKMAASIGDVSAAKTKMAAPTVNVSATKTNMAASIGNMVPTIANMATTKSNKAASIGNTATSKSNMTAPIGSMAPTVANVAATKSNMATNKTNATSAKSNMAAPIANMAGTTANMAAVEHHGAAMDSKMAAGRTGRPLERKDGTKGPVGRSQPLGAGLWPLPFLFLLLLL
ncbi:ly6/PLAUR domain-containing protein 3 [Amazona ochrocephala]